MSLRLYTSPTGWAIFLDYEWEGVRETRRKPWEKPLRRVIYGLFVEGPKQFVLAAQATGRCRRDEGGLGAIGGACTYPCECLPSVFMRSHMPGTFDRMKKHFSLCAQHLQQFKTCLSTENQFMMLLDSVPETTGRWISAAGRLRAIEEAPCEMCLTSHTQ